MKRVSILGATGSIGCQTIELIEAAPERFEVVALTGGRNVALLAEQAKRLRPGLAVTCHDDCRAELTERLLGTGIEVASGDAAVAEAARMQADWVMSAIVGAAGLVPGLAAIRQGATLALANKETMVAAGPLVLEAARAHGATLLPVDSEHSAVFQALVGEDRAAVERVILTASGGAFRDWPLERLATATPEQAATHPNWSMGQRITIDSASMFNKALEVIEARELFGLAPDQVEVVIHPESLIHALVGFNDGALMAHMGAPDMRHAIGYALNWPERRDLPVARLDLAATGSMTFRAPDEARYPALRQARRVMEEGGLAGAAFNAAKEAALDAFLDRRIGFLQMAQVVEQVLDTMSRAGALRVDIPGLDAVLGADAEARERAARISRTDLQTT
ncbi:1-deoxy-D-xylulose 5-phosphate reductoisomerase [Limimaricola soesokkakensis]|uniref:1-deoxy-D-xylulose 5-phosphate reductoisomerase n=1 Tax=Limimaricola soesokkakensis TaxID=1343159 RepID=A0A1X6ZGG7_9RHOB|nr:1-deoxy-D-xylulose-5-phosphate reductoisomerase [Limimaricola soesokkakensis]PSK86052.1 1-deoxy-D-xylulose 5-phosphate reductoisomerase [Limimaricola soesokkakensis]SLN50970.1 1-deoxy-D-xylulose 5-phosphate reductoisomerase [Limimaricola soesokkakensis]